MEEVLTTETMLTVTNTTMPDCSDILANSTLNGSTACSTKPPTMPAAGIDTLTIIIVILYGLICTIGLLGNGLVIFVIIRYTKMKTVTNMYILNLSMADGCFVLGLPLIITTAWVKSWLFGGAMCKLYYILTCINMFTGPFTLAVMAGDRFLAVCYPFSSMRYRTPRYALVAICLIWVVSFLVMMPVVLFAQNMPSPYREGLYSCTMQWPSAAAAAGQKIFLIYTLLLGFALPVLIISVLYTLLVIRLKTTGPQNRSAEKRRSHKKVTKLVTLIIAVFITCWLPYWAFQIDLIVTHKTTVSSWSVYMFQGFTILSYANSAINPVLYAFTNDNFREAFINAFKCAADPILGGPGRRVSEYTTVNHNKRRQSPNTEEGNEAECLNGNGSVKHSTEMTQLTNSTVPLNGNEKELQEE